MYVLSDDTLLIQTQFFYLLSLAMSTGMLSVVVRKFFAL